MMNTIKVDWSIAVLFPDSLRCFSGYFINLWGSGRQGYSPFVAEKSKNYHLSSTEMNIIMSLCMTHRCSQETKQSAFSCISYRLPNDGLDSHFLMIYLAAWYKETENTSQIVPCTPLKTMQLKHACSAHEEEHIQAASLKLVWQYCKKLLSVDHN